MHVLIPVDGSSHSKKAFDYALDQFPEPKITLLHVVNPTSSFGYSDEDYFDLEGYQQEAKRQHERGEKLLEEYRETAEERGMNVETILKTGKPSREILATIEDTDVDHIVMGSRGRSGVGRALFGSVAETVTRRAPVPVTIVR